MDAKMVYPAVNLPGAEELNYFLFSIFQNSDLHPKKKSELFICLLFKNLLEILFECLFLNASVISFKKLVLSIKV